MKKTIFPIFLGIAILLCLGGNVLAYQIQDLPDTEVLGDIVVGPTKVELFLDPGESSTKEIMVTNRTGKTINFSLGVEDFEGSQNPDQPVVFLGPDKGPYSLKDWMDTGADNFTLKHGQRIILSVKISVPNDADPGGHYGVVFTSVNPPVSENEAPQAQVSVIARAGILFFVRVSGAVDENGYLKEFKIDKNLYENGPVSFNLFFQNDGSVHLAPYGTIEIKNILGRKVGEIEMDPWFVMPGSLRSRQITWEKGFLLGKYTATVYINRGYENQDIIDEKSVEFWAIPWKILLAGLAALVLAIWFLFWIASHFEIKKKTTS